MTVLALIPARAGSERLPGKNMVDLCGRPLVAWTIECAIAAWNNGAVDMIAVSSDWPALLNYVRDTYDTRVYRLHRPAHLSTALSTSLDMQEHALQRLRDDCSFRPDIIMLLQPTSPLRTKDDIIAVLDIMQERNADAVVSVTKTSESAYELGHADRLRPISALSSRSFVIPNGAIYAITADAIDRGETWWTALTYCYVMPKTRSLDIDTVEDLAMAKQLMERVIA